jgi:hypothetical protein
MINKLTHSFVNEITSLIYIEVLWATHIYQGMPDKAYYDSKCMGNSVPSGLARQHNTINMNISLSICSITVFKEHKESPQPRVAFSSGASNRRVRGCYMNSELSVTRENDEQIPHHSGPSLV